MELYTIVSIGVMVGITNLMVVVLMLTKIIGLNKKFKKMATQLKNNKVNINKIIEIMDVLIKKKKGKDKINLN